MTDQSQDTAAAAAPTAETAAADLKSRLIAAVQRSPWTAAVCLAAGVVVGVTVGVLF
jgi:ABC-type dipeptide/oligopeptide/nickel transport system permease subunit